MKNSEERFRTLIEKATDVVIVLDATGKITYQSPSLERVTGYGYNEWVDKSLSELLIHPDDLPSLVSLLERVLTQPGTTVEGVTARYKHKDGSWHTLEATVTNMLGDPKVNGLVANFHDITERKRTEEALQASEERNRLLIDNAAEVVTVLQDGLIKFINRKSIDFSGYSPEELISKPFIELIHPDDRQMVADNYVKRLSGGEVPGAYEFRVLDKNGLTKWAAASVALLTWEGRPASLGLLSDITERKRMEDALRSSEQRNRLLVDNANEAITVVQDGVLKFVNPKFAQLSGYDAKELASKPFVELVHPDDQQMLAEYYVRRQKGEEVPHIYQFKFIDKAGNTRWAEINAVSFDWEGRPATLGLLNDITERKKAQETLRESEEKFRLLTEMTNDIIWMTDMNLRTTYVSPSAERLLGFRQEELLGFGPESQMTPESVARAQETLLKHLEMEQDPMADPHRTATLELEYCRKDGSTIWMENRISGIRDANGRLIGLHGVARDVSERRRAREVLRESEERFRTLIEKSTDAIAILDATGKTLYESPSMERITGYKLEDWLGKRVDDWLFMHPDDMVAMASLLERLLSHPEETSDFSARFKHKDGSWHFLEGTVRNLLGDPKVNGIVANYRDVTERRRAEEAVRFSEARFRGLVETTSDWVWEINPNTRYTYVSPKVRDILGYEPQELLGRTPFEFMHQREGRRVSKIVRRFADAHLPFSLLENTCTHKDGHSVVLETSAVPIIDSDGSFLGYRGIDRDITERKKVEQELQRSLKRLERTMESTIEAITTTIETRDPYTTGHQMRVTDLACAIARVMELPPTQIEGIRVAGLLHDIGKIAIPTEILSKPGRLNEVEYEMIKTHAKVGYNILKKIEFPWPVARAVLQHHERWNGSGYPHGIRGEDILPEARILAVADVMEAMASHRPYRPSVGLDKALDEISKNSGILYDPAVAKACVTAFTQAGFKFASSVPGVVADSGSTSSDRPVHSPEDR